MSPQTADFYEDDEPAAEVLGAWDRAPKHLTGWPVQPDVDPFTGLSAHEHGESCDMPECCGGN